MTQNQAVKEYIVKHGSITAKQALSLGIHRLAARIKDLKDMGEPIYSEMITVKSRYGKARVSRYYLR